MRNSAERPGLKIQAMVARDEGLFAEETVWIDEPLAGEVRIKIAAVGICHTDAHVLHGNFPYPKPFVLGHEGSGVVEAVGPGVASMIPGDHVVLTFNSCGVCTPCIHEHPAYCDAFAALNFAGVRPNGTVTLNNGQGGVHGSFFSQSSFATHAIAMERNVIRVSREAPLELLGPLACGIQTGAGTVLNVLRPHADQALAVFGSGAVGLSAIMAARLAGCKTIIAIDIRPNRLQLAQELGATHLIDSNRDNAREILAALGGVDFAVDTTGLAPVIDAAFANIKVNGVCALVGAAKPGNTLPIDLFHTTLGRTLKGVIEGDSVPQTFIPFLIDEHKAGRFPFDKLIRYYRFDQINQAFADMESGGTIKPVLRLT